MKKNVKTERILGRRLAQEMTRTELERASGSYEESAERTVSAATYTLTYPADRDPRNDGPIWV
jgi:hypothetical protein